MNLSVLLPQCKSLGAMRLCACTDSVDHCHQHDMVAKNVDQIEKMNIVVYNLSWMIPTTIIVGLLIPYEFRLLNGIFDGMSYSSSSDSGNGIGIAWILPLIVALAFFRPKCK